MSWASADERPIIQNPFDGAAHEVTLPRAVVVDDARWSARVRTLQTRDGLRLPLFRYARDGESTEAGGPAFGGGPPILLLHGATAWSESFAVPTRDNLVRALLARGHDVWLLDWRGGRWVSGWYVQPEVRERITFDAAAEFDVWGALEVMHAEGCGRNVRIGGHCMGSNITAMAVAEGPPSWLAQDARDAIEIRAIQLSTIGLFYVQPWDGFLRANDYLLERIVALHPDCPGVHCNGDPEAWPGGLDCWPDELQRAYELWPARLLPGRPAPRGQVRAQVDNDGVPDAFTRLSFMFGRVVQWNALDPELQTQEAFTRQFGMMPIALYIHAGQNVRRGLVGRYGAPEGRDVFAGPPVGLDHYLVRPPFRELRRVTLITGSENDLWHRDAIDRMADWLLAGRGAPAPDWCVKHVVDGFAHQDLLWGAGQAGDAVRQRYVEALSDPALRERT